MNVKGIIASAAMALTMATVPAQATVLGGTYVGKDYAKLRSTGLYTVNLLVQSGTSFIGGLHNADPFTGKFTGTATIHLAGKVVKGTYSGQATAPVSGQQKFTGTIKYQDNTTQAFKGTLVATLVGPVNGSGIPYRIFEDVTLSFIKK